MQTKCSWCESFVPEDEGHTLLYHSDKCLICDECFAKSDPKQFED